jgi:allantoinase
MSKSGIDDFQSADDQTLYDGMACAARLGRIVAVHAENDQITGLLARRAVAEGHVSARDYLQSRPVVAELEAISRAILLADETGCKLHIVHVSSGRGVSRIAEARARGVDVSCDTCPHYLVLNEDDLDALGAVAKCAPPLRPQSEQEQLWQYLLSGTLPMIASDHSPAPPEMKGLDPIGDEQTSRQGTSPSGDLPASFSPDLSVLERSFFKVWGGISGCQSTLQLLLTDGYTQRQLPLATIAHVTSEFVARRFGLPQKGRLAVGADADMVLVDLAHSATLHASDLHYRYRHSPYIGRTLRGRIARTIVRGTTIFLDGQIVAAPLGRLLRPATS